MKEKEIYLTAEGLKKMEDDLEQLKTVKRKEVAERIRQAISYGDISENSEYDDAKNEQAFVEGSILDLEKKLRNVIIISEEVGDHKIVRRGSKVTILDVDRDSEKVYMIVGSSEADPKQGKISDESPIGKAVLDAKVGSIVKVETPGGERSLKICSIQ